MEDRWFSGDEIAAYVGIKRDTVYKWTAEKRMLGAELLRWLRSGVGERSLLESSSTGIRLARMRDADSVRKNAFRTPALHANPGGVSACASVSKAFGKN